MADAARGGGGKGWRGSARVAVILPLGALLFAVTVLAIKAWPAVKVNGFSFLTGSEWNYGSAYGATVHTDGVAHPMGSKFGAWPIILGTIQSSAIALIFALPISIGAAFALTERLPGWITRPLGFAIEILAGIPSVVIGLWGLLALGPFLAKHVYPIIADHAPNVPVLRYFRNPVGGGEGLLTAGIVLGLMIVPIITATTRDLFLQVPALPREGGEALGMTDWEVAQRITIPWVRSGIIGATVLGLGRALGETIAMVLVGGSALRLSLNIFNPFGTLAPTIFSTVDGAMGR